jgi:ribose/xylose/arabinose/galactoside ABC-type transport system permease subunit
MSRSDADRALTPSASLRRRGSAVLTLAGPYVGLVLVIGLFSYLTWQRGTLNLFLSASNFKLLAVHAAIPAAVALGMTVIMISGGIDLSVGHVVSLATVVTMLAFRQAVEQPWRGYLANRFHLEIPYVEFIAATASVWAVTAGLSTGLAAGWTNGALIARLGVVPFVITLGMMGVARGLAQLLSGGTPVVFPDPAHPPAWVAWLGAIEPQPAWLGIGPAAWSVLLLAAATAVLLRYTVLGRYCYALGSNEATARLCGIPVERTKIVLYTLAGLLTGWGGILQFARSRAGLHDAAPGLELEVIAAVVIGGGSLTGGEGTVGGSIAGALMIATLSNGCSKLGLPMEFRFIVIGLIIVLVSAVNTWRQRRLP